jgi:hypothetical protein
MKTILFFIGLFLTQSSMAQIYNDVIVEDALTLDGKTASTVPYLDASKVFQSSAVTPTELGYLSGVTSAIQTQLNGKEATITATTAADYFRGDKTFQPFDAAARAAVLTGFVSGAGTVAATDTFLQAFQKLDGNIALKLNTDSFTQGSVLFRGAAAITQDNANFFYNNTTKKLGIGTATPTGTLDIFAEEGTTGVPHITLSGNVNEAGTISRNIAGNGGYISLLGGSTPTGGGGIYINGNGVADGGSVQLTLGEIGSNFDVFDSTISVLRFRVTESGLVGIGTPYGTPPAQELEVVGDVRISGLTASLPVKTNATKDLISGAIDLTSEVSGILPIANGGTGSSSSIVVQTITNGNTTTVSSEDALFDALALKEDLANKNANNGYAGLDAGGKISASQLPNTVMEYQGNWNANTNSPALADGVGNAGDVYRANVAGSTNFGSGAIAFSVGDWAVYNGTIWELAQNSNFVVSVNGQQGVVVLDTDDVAEGTALYFTEARVRATPLTGFTPGVGVVAATDSVLQAFQKIDANVGALVTGVSSVHARTGAVVSANGDYTASQVTNAPAGNIAAIQAQAAINELDTEKEPNITATTSADYYRGDKTFQNLNAAAIASVLTGFTSGAGVVTAADSLLTAIQKLDGNISASVSGVSSVFGRAGAVIAANGDYTASNITNVAAGNIASITAQAAINELDTEKEPSITGTTAADYFSGAKTFLDFGTSTRAALLTGFVSGSGTVAATDSVLQAFNKLDGNIGLKQNTLTNSAGLAGALSDETGTGFAVFSADAALTGNPTAPTQAANDNSTKLATTAYADAAATASGNASVNAYVNISANTTGSGASKTYFADTSGGAFTFTLPLAASFSGVSFAVKNTDFGGSNDVSVARSGANLIETGTSDVVTPGDIKTYKSNGITWYLVN